MSDSRTDFFTRLELELRAAAGRSPRRTAGWSEAARWTGAAAAAIAAVGLAVTVALVVLGGGSDDAGNRAVVDHQSVAPSPLPVGSVIRRNGEEHIVVATGTAPGAGPWQLEAYKSTRLADPETGEEYQPAGLPCLGVALLDPPPDDPTLLSGGCGEFPRTPGFGRGQMSVPPGGRRADGTPVRVREILVYGRAPEGASAVVLTADGGVRDRMEPFEGPESVAGDFYLFAVPPDLKNGRVNWLDGKGNEGSRGIELLPP
jgi:hypothetical protein